MSWILDLAALASWHFATPRRRASVSSRCPDRHEFCPAAHRSNLRCRSIFPRLAPAFAAEIGGVDLACPLDPATVDGIWSAIDRYAVVIFRNQRLTDAQRPTVPQKPAEDRPGRGAGGPRRLAIPQIGDISNLDANNKVRRLDDRRRLDSLEAGSGTPTPPTCRCRSVLGMLHARRRRPRRSATARPSSSCALPTTRCPRRRGRRSTDWWCSTTCSGRAADRRHRVPTGRARTVPAVAAASGAPASRLEAPGTLYLSAHASHVIGWPVADGRLLLWDLYRACDAAGVRLQPQLAGGRCGDWDNRCTMHRGRPHDENQPRDLRLAE